MSDRDDLPLDPALVPDLESEPTQVRSPRDAAPTRVTPQERSRSSADRSLLPGDEISDRYRVVATLGVGGMGIVYRVHDEVLDLDLALKMLRPEMAQDQELMTRFRNELIVARQVTHRHVVRNHDLGEHEGSFFMTMDLVEGRSLREVLAEEGRLTSERAIALTRQIAAALAEAHRQGIVHRDLKPANILLDAAGDAYVTDFGIARSLQSAGLTRTGEVIGTPDYLSPEQARGEKVDQRSDIYTLGLMLIEMLSGKLPFPGGTLFEILSQRMQGKVTSLQELGVQVKPELRGVIDRCIEKDLGLRYATAEELITDLDLLAGGRVPRRRWAGNRRAVLWAAAPAALALIVFGAYRLATRPAEDPAPVAGTETPSATPAQVEPRYSVAVLPFVGAGGDSELAWTATGVPEMISMALAENASLHVIDSVRVFQTLKDLGFQAESLRPDEVEQVAGFFQVDRLVFGTVLPAGGEVRLQMRLLDTDRAGASPRVIGTESGPADELVAMVERLGSGLAEALEVAGEMEAPPPSTTSATAMQAYSEGLEALSLGETLKAAPALERAVSQDPTFSAAWVRLSQTYEQLGRDDEALEAATKAVAALGTAGGRIVYEARAQEASLRGEPREAQEILEELVTRFPHDHRALVNLAQAYAGQGRFADAVARLRQAADIDASEPRTLYLLGVYSIQAGNGKSAVDDYLPRALGQHTRLRNEQGQADVHNALGVGYQNLGLIEEAVRSFSEAAEIRERIGDRGGLATSLTNLASIALLRGEYATAHTNLTKALELQTDLGDLTGIAYSNDDLGSLEEDRGRYAEAFEYYDRALQIRQGLGNEADLAESHYNLGYTYYLRGRYKDALIYLEKAQALFEKLGAQAGILPSLQNIGICRLAQGDFQEASKSLFDSLQLAREVDRKDGEAVSQAFLGRVAQYQGRYGGALDNYREALAFFADLGDPRSQIAIMIWEIEALFEVGAFEDAGERLEEAAALAAEQQEQKAMLLVLRGRVHLGRGEAPAAGELFARAQPEAEASGSAQAILKARLGAGLAALAAGETAAAVEMLNAVVDEADRLGHVVLQLQAKEDLARAALAAGDPQRAEKSIRGALTVASRARIDSYARSFHLHLLLARAASQLGHHDASDAWDQAQKELARVRDSLDEELRASFDQLPGVRELLSGTPPSG